MMAYPFPRVLSRLGLTMILVLGALTAPARGSIKLFDSEMVRSLEQKRELSYESMYSPGDITYNFAFRLSNIPKWSPLASGGVTHGDTDGDDTVGNGTDGADKAVGAESVSDSARSRELERLARLSFVVAQRRSLFRSSNHELIELLADCSVMPMADETLPNNTARTAVRFDPDTLEGELSGTFAVSEPGLYTAYFLLCRPFMSDVAVAVSGKIEFKNPHGYLPAHKHPYLYLYFAMTSVYIVMTTIWASFCYRYNSQLFSYHYFALAIAAASCVEMLFKYIEFQYFNHYGEYLSAAYVYGIGAVVVRKTLSRVLIIALSLGVGIARPTMKASSKLALGFVSALYFFILGAVELRRVHQLREELDQATLAMELALVVIDAVYYVWIFSALAATLDTLKQHESFKQKVYNKFSLVLVAALLATTVFNLYDLHFRRETQWATPTGWANYWFVDEGYWSFQTALVLTAIMVLWRPSENSGRYAYSEQVPTGEDSAVDRHTSDVDDIDDGGRHVDLEAAEALVSASCDVDRQLDEEAPRETTDDRRGGTQRGLPFSIDEYDDDLEIIADLDINDELDAATLSDSPHMAPPLHLVPKALKRKKKKKRSPVEIAPTIAARAPNPKYDILDPSDDDEMSTHSEDDDSDDMWGETGSNKVKEAKRKKGRKLARAKEDDDSGGSTMSKHGSSKENELGDNGGSLP